jgi:hypothetical protein
VVFVVDVLSLHDPRDNRFLCWVSTLQRCFGSSATLRSASPDREVSVIFLHCGRRMRPITWDRTTSKSHFFFSKHTTCRSYLGRIWIDRLQLSYPPSYHTQGHHPMLDATCALSPVVWVVVRSNPSSSWPMRYFPVLSISGFILA